MSDLRLHEEVFPTKCFHVAWVKAILNDCAIEALEMSHIKPMQQDGRVALWNICDALGLKSCGVPGEACRIFERYIYTLIAGYAKINDPILRDAVIENLQKRLVLMMTCSVILAAKMSSASIFINAQVVRVYLLCKGIHLSVEDIVVTELEIYKAIKFKIPSWTGVEIGLFLATVIKMTAHDMRGLELIVDLAEYYKGAIENEVRRATHLPPQFRRNGGSIVRTLHLAAGAVAAASKLSYSPDVSHSLAHLLKVPVIYINCLCDIIVTQVRRSDRPQNNEPLNLKRKWNIE